MATASEHWPFFAEDEVAKVAEVMRSGRVNYWTGGEGRAFEQEYAAATQRRHGIAVANGTLALELALYAFGIGTGDDVLTPARTYIASAGCSVLRGARPVIADVDRDSQVVTAATLRAALTPATRAIMVVHLAGWPCPMDEIMALAQEHGLVVIEDCAQAHGATWKGRPVGSFGHAAAFSFCQDKIITTCGEGGMLVLDDEAAWQRAWSYKDIGRSFDAVFNRQHPPGFRWLSESFGSNFRMTEMQAAVGRMQLAKLPAWSARRRYLAETLEAGLRGLPGLRVPTVAEGVGHANYRCYAFVRPECLAPGWSRDRINAEVNAAGVTCSVGSCSEIYLEKAFVDRGWGPSARLPVARELGETSLAFLVHPSLSDQSIQRAIDVVRTVIFNASH
ncbi:DegT/DnrJ/EryC1/StrS family aminotransferase [Roseateles oligotrophus]|uniref:DegT/DnrJ/EryC1/StrS aminotransferase family protein n=1 Tax=Roseateles oligotrophus TaxID=1769250 RepID=A0ABT2YDZ4_9BURK|nr:DegT/DnrJ/EryC1/StrS aminotransferase family protein [Roseateles oligotrophus]